MLKRRLANSQSLRHDFPSFFFFFSPLFSEGQVGIQQLMIYQMLHNQLTYEQCEMTANHFSKAVTNLQRVEFRAWWICCPA